MPPTTPAKTPPATPKKIRGPIVPLKEGIQRCHARIWAQGRGGQCKRPGDGSKLCKMHQADAAKHEGVPLHGFIDGEIPPVKLEEFLKIAGKNGWEMASPDAPTIKAVFLFEITEKGQETPREYSQRALYTSGHGFCKVITFPACFWIGSKEGTVLRGVQCVQEFCRIAVLCR